MRMARACRKITPRRANGSKRPPTAATMTPMTSLGALYDNGQGVSRDYVNAREWFEKAAALGEAGVMLDLGGSMPTATACRKTTPRRANGMKKLRPRR